MHTNEHIVVFVLYQNQYLSSIEFKNSNFDSLFPNNLLRSFDNVAPVLENSLSDGTDVAKIQNIF